MSAAHEERGAPALIRGLDLGGGGRPVRGLTGEVIQHGRYLRKAYGDCRRFGREPIPRGQHYQQHWHR